MKRPRLKAPKMKWRIVWTALNLIYQVARDHVEVDKRDGEWLVIIHVPNNPFNYFWKKKENKADDREAESAAGDSA